MSVSSTDPFKHRPFYTQTLLHTDDFIHRRFDAKTLLRNNAFTHRPFHTQTLLHTDACTRRQVYAKTRLHTDAFTDRCLYTHNLLRTNAFTRRCFYTQMLLHTQASTHRCFYTQMLPPTQKRLRRETLLHTHTQTHLHADPFTHRRFYTQMLLCPNMRKLFYTQKLSPQFLTLDHHFARKGCASTSEIATSPQLKFLTPSFRAKGLRANLRNRNFTTRVDIKTYESEQPLPMPCCHAKDKPCYLSFWRSNLISRERVVAAHSKSQFSLSFWRSNLISCERVVAAHSKSQFNLSKFLAIEPHFVRKGCRGTLKIAI